MTCIDWIKLDYFLDWAVAERRSLIDECSTIGSTSYEGERKHSRISVALRELDSLIVLAVVSAKERELEAEDGTPT